MSISTVKVKSDYMKFKQCIAEGDPLNLVRDNEAVSNCSVTTSFMYPVLDQKYRSGEISNISEQLKNAHGSIFQFLVYGVEAKNRVPDIVTANHLLNLLNEGDYSWIYIGDYRQESTKPKLDYIKALITVAQYNDYLENSFKYYGRDMSEGDILKQMNMSKTQLSSFKKLLKENAMWELKPYEFTDVVAGTSLPSWFTALLSSCGAKQLSQLEAERIANESKQAPVQSTSS